METCITIQRVGELRDCIEALNTEYEELSKAQSRIDLIQQDLLHFLENETFDAYTGYKVAVKLKKTRIQRREIKDRLGMIEDVRKRLGCGGFLKDSVWNALEKYQDDTRQYRYRVISKEKIKE